MSFRPILVASLLLAVGACRNGASTPLESSSQIAVDLDQTFVLAPGQEASVDALSLIVRVDSVAGDSRCPTDVTCVWAGDADVHLTILRGKRLPVTAVVRVTRDPRSIADGDEVIELVSLSPATAAGVTIRQGDYRVGLVIRAKAH